MISVTFNGVLIDDDCRIHFSKTLVGMTVEGHTGFAVKGEDVICAAVSALAQSCVLALTKVVKVRQEIVQRDGFLSSSIDVGSAGERADEIGAVLGMLIVGLQEIRDADGKFLEIIFL